MPEALVQAPYHLGGQVVHPVQSRVVQHELVFCISVIPFGLQRCHLVQLHRLLCLILILLEERLEVLVLLHVPEDLQDLLLLLHDLKSLLLRQVHSLSVFGVILPGEPGKSLSFISVDSLGHLLLLPFTLLSFGCARDALTLLALFVLLDPLLVEQLLILLFLFVFFSLFFVSLLDFLLLFIG